MIRLLITQIILFAAITLYAPINGIGLKGNISFAQVSPGQPVQISVFLISNLELFKDHKYSWTIHSNPVFYGFKQACSKTELGKIDAKLNDRHGALEPSNAASNVQFLDSELDLFGAKTIWGKSIALQSLNSSKPDLITCSNIFDGSESKVKTAEAIFTQNLSGKVIFRESESGATQIYVNLFQTMEGYKQATKQDWKIMVTDILDTRPRASKCAYLSQILDAENKDDRIVRARITSFAKRAILPESMAR